MGIIDYLQKWNCSKRTEKYTKQITKCNSNLDISSQPPSKYGERMLKQFEEHTGVKRRATGGYDSAISSNSQR
jgi:hypothetical protein